MLMASNLSFGYSCGDDVVSLPYLSVYQHSAMQVLREGPLQSAGD